MRIISGSLRGRRIPATVRSGTRPTTDMVRESIFNILNHRKDFEGTTVLDLFAGTGALGFEALSRGAEHCTFVEKSPLVSKAITTTAHEFSIEREHFSCLTMDVLKFLQENDTQFDLIFADPPYMKGLANSALEIIAAKKMLKEDGICVIETGSREQLIMPETIELLSDRTFGESKIWILGLR